MQQVIVTIVSRGGTLRLNGWWTRFGERFSYRGSDGGVRSCVFDPRNSNVIYVTRPNGSQVMWRRGAPQQRQNTYNRRNTYQNQNYNRSSGMDPRTWNNNIRRNQGNQGYGVPRAPQPQHDPTADPKAWLEHIQRQQGR